MISSTTSIQPVRLLLTLLLVSGLVRGGMVPSIVLGQERTANLQKEASNLIPVLSSQADLFTKAKACQRLAVIGDSSAIEALANLLASPELAGYARSALEQIPGDASKRAIREALPVLKGPQLVGAIHSLGKLRDQASTEALGGLLSHGDAAVVAAAAKSLGAIGTGEAATRLQTALTSVDKPQDAIVVACLACAQRLVESKQLAEAARLLEAVRQANIAKHLQDAALYDLIVAQGKDALELLRPQLNSKDAASFRLAIQAARRIGPAAVPVLKEVWKSLPAARQEVAIMAMGDIDPQAALSDLLLAADSEHPGVQLVAIRSLATHASDQGVEKLFQAASAEVPEVAAEALASLILCEHREIESRTAQLLRSEDVRQQAIGIQLAGARNQKSATDRLMEISKSPQSPNRVAAIQALGNTVDSTNFDQLLAIALQAKEEQTASAAKNAVQMAVYRLPQEPAAAVLHRAYAEAPTEKKVFLLEQLASVGGKQALTTIAEAAAGDAPELQDAATRLLGEWLTPDVAPWLIKLAESLQEQKYQLRALRGAIRVAKQLDMPSEDRMQICEDVLHLAKRDEERGLVLDVLRQYPTQAGLRLAVEQVKQKQLAPKAGGVAVTIGQKIMGEQPQAVIAAMQELAVLLQGTETGEQAKQLLEQARAR